MKKLVSFSVLTATTLSAIVMPSMVVVKNVNETKAADEKDFFPKFYKKNGFTLEKDQQFIEKLREIHEKYSSTTKLEDLSIKEKFELEKLKRDLFNYVGIEIPKTTSRAWTYWSWFNLYVNLTKSETRWWMNSLKKIQGFIDVTSFISGLTEEASSLASEMAQSTKFEGPLKLLHLLSKVSNLYWHYFNYNHLLNVLDGNLNNTLAYRLTFGFIPTGVYKASENRD